MEATDDQQWLTKAIEELRAEVARLSDRIVALEVAAAPGPGVASSRERLGAPREADADLAFAVSAAIAAYLGVKPRIKHIRLAGGASWAQQGRVTIQASHALRVIHR